MPGSSDVIFGRPNKGFDLNREPSNIFKNYSRSFFGKFSKKFLEFSQVVILKFWNACVYLINGEKGKQDWICINWLIIKSHLFNYTAKVLLS